MLPDSYAGRILKIDLSTRKTVVIDTAHYADRFLGGRGIATALYRDLVPPEASAEGPENALIAMTGPLAGLPAIGGSRWGLFAKSTATPRREHFCYGNLGGGFGAELKFAGFDGMVVNGIADEPVVVSIHGGDGNEKVVLEPAGELVGRGADETIEALKGRYGSKTKGMAVGPAGEARIPFASVLAEGGASCSGGMGAVMGTKNLKAIAVTGTNRRVPVADRETLKEIERRIRGWDRGNVKVWGLDFMAHGEKTRKMPCYGCMANCLRVKYTADDGTAGKYMCQSRFFYMALAWAYYGEENDIAFRANRLCDQAGVDTWALQDIVDWLVRCRDAGALDNNRTGLPLDTIGSLEFVETLLDMLIHRKDFGEILSRGAETAAREIGGAPGAQFRHHDPYEPRYCPVNTFLIPFETRIPIQQLHEAGLTVAKWSSKVKGTVGAHVDSAVVRGIAERFWGGAEAADFTTLKGKALAAKKIQDRQIAKECLCVCDWMYPILDIPVKDKKEGTVIEGIVGDPAVEAAVLRAAIGGDWDEAALDELGERVFQLQRAILLAEGHVPKEEDVLPREWHEVPLDGHVADPDCLVPGPGGAPVSRLGAVVGMTEYLPARDEYYAMRGWDARSGLPTAETLRKVGLDDVVEDQKNRGLVAARARGPSVGDRMARIAMRRAAKRRSRDRDRSASAAPAPVSDHREIITLLTDETAKYADKRISHNFAGWNKAMQYTFPDADAHYVIRFSDGEPLPPERLQEPLDRPEIEYIMDTAILRAMASGELSGMQAYQQRKLKTKAAFGDLMKLQALNKVS